MKAFIIFTAIIIIVIVIIVVVSINNQRSVKIVDSIKGNNMEIVSPVFANNEEIPAKYTCDGEGINPPLKFEKIPKGTQSLALIVDDPDAPMGTWVHWTVWNISSQIREIGEGNVPEGAIEGVTSFGKPGYGGPCPPSGTHRYFFKLYALDSKLSLDQTANKNDLEKAIDRHILAKAELIGLYSRK